MTEHLHDIVPNKKKPRKLLVVKPSKYETHGAIHTNKEYWNKAFRSSDTQNVKSESQKLSEVLPPDLYDRVCDTLKIPKIPVENVDIEKGKTNDEITPKIVKRPFLSRRYSLFIERDMDSDTDVIVSPREKQIEPNVHLELLQRPEREQITWPTRYLQPEREDEKTLVKKADDLTNKIAEEFCEYMRQLGGDQQSNLFTPKAIKELFQIEFDTHCAKGLSLVTKELHNIPEKTANLTSNQQLTKFSILDREVQNDIKAESIPDRIHAFGRSLSQQDQWRAPRNETSSSWRTAKHVPKDLVTLKTVWEGITNLKSVKEYCRWMIGHPEHRRAPYLSSLGYFDTAVLDARLTYDYGHDETQIDSSKSSGSEPIENLRRRLSEMTDSKMV